MKKIICAAMMLMNFSSVIGAAQHLVPADVNAIWSKRTHWVHEKHNDVTRTDYANLDNFFYPLLLNEDNFKAVREKMISAETLWWRDFFDEKRLVFSDEMKDFLSHDFFVKTTEVLLELIPIQHDQSCWDSFRERVKKHLIAHAYENGSENNELKKSALNYLSYRIIYDFWNALKTHLPEPDSDISEKYQQFVSNVDSAMIVWMQGVVIKQSSILTLRRETACNIL